ncbi:MAG: hypothetical protein ACRC2T_15395 [Thermoguttaceae bacterium]
MEYFSAHRKHFDFGLLVLLQALAQAFYQPGEPLEQRAEELVQALVQALAQDLLPLEHRRCLHRLHHNL